jgi:hypothetical protein
MPGNVVTPVGANGAPLPVIMLGGTSQNVTYLASGSASAQSTAFSAGCTMVQISVHLGATATGVRIAGGTNPTATATSTLLPASGTWFCGVSPGWKIAALSDDANGGSINITEAPTWG